MSGVALTRFTRAGGNDQQRQLKHGCLLGSGCAISVQSCRDIVGDHLSAVRAGASDQAILSDVRLVVHSGTVNGRAFMFGRNRTNCAKSGFRFGNV